MSLLILHRLEDSKVFPSVMCDNVYQANAFLPLAAHLDIYRKEDRASGIDKD